MVGTLQLLQSYFGMAPTGIGVGLTPIQLDGLLRTVVDAGEAHLAIAIHTDSVATKLPVALGANVDTSATTYAEIAIYPEGCLRIQVSIAFEIMTISVPVLLALFFCYRLHPMLLLADVSFDLSQILLYVLLHLDLFVNIMAHQEVIDHDDGGQVIKLDAFFLR